MEQREPHETRHHGVVKKWRSQNGWGFVVRDDTGAEVYVNRADLVAVSDLHPGLRVSFVLALQQEDDHQNAGKSRAVDVKVLEADTAALNSVAVVGTACTGVVKRWLSEKGFGFLIPDGGGDDVYVHQSALVSTSELCAGDKVSFLLEYDGKRGKARSVKVIQAGTAGSLFADLPVVEEKFSDILCGMDLLLQLASEDKPDTMEFLQPFLLKSSLNCSFLVLSDSQLVEDVRAPSTAELDRLICLVSAFVDGCETSRAVMLVDFEGEMPGYGGEITTAQLQLTSALDTDSMVPRSLPCSQRFAAPGLLIDLRCPRCVDILRRVMEVTSITKLLWGADGDCQSLMYQAVPMSLNVDPAAIIDLQVGFDAKFRVGMATMLQYVPQHLLEGLPTKEQIDWDFFHSRNCRALPLPLSRLSALYAVDDLHRLEAILASKRPPGGSYAGARQATEEMLTALRADPSGLETLKQGLIRLEKRDGIKKAVKAVEILRHICAIRIRGLTSEGSACCTAALLKTIHKAEDFAKEVLQKVGTEVASDLSFNAKAPDVEACLAAALSGGYAEGSRPVDLKIA